MDVIGLQQTSSRGQCRNISDKESYELRTKLEARVKRFLLVGIAFGALIAPAVAADMPIKAPAPSPQLWNGFYVGLNAGYADTQNSIATAGSPTPDVVLGVVPGVSEGLASLASGKVRTGSGTGFEGGGQIGYNLQLNKILVGGIEADIQGLTGSSNGSITSSAIVIGVPVTSTQTASESTKWLGTVRARLGLLVTPTWLVYATGGVAFGGINGSSSLAQAGTNGFIGAGAGSFSDTRWGGAFGAGLEWMFARGWSAKAEYLYYDLGNGSFNYSATSGFFAVPVYQNVANAVHFSGGLARLGVNYHF
jgi:outer membrane immunogenic protein